MRVVPAIAVLLCVAGSPFDAQRQDDAADAARLVDVLRIEAGTAVADIGAGQGELTLRIAERVSPTGRVYSTDINPQRLEDIRQAASTAGLGNVTVLEGGSTRTNLPDACCDAIFMRHVYHHLGDPAAMSASIRQSLKPGGRLAVVDFAPDSGRSAPPGRRDASSSHGVTAETVIEELTQAGFENVRQLSWPSSGYFLVVGELPRR